MLLACESFPLLAGSASRLLGAHRRATGAFPFVTMAPAPESESAVGQWLGDFWAPVWNRPMTVAEVEMLFRSGRAELDGKAALTAAAFAGAIVNRGVDAGIAEFRCFTLQRTTSENTFESQLSKIVSVPRLEPIFSGVMKRAIAFRDNLPPDRKRYQGLQGPLDRSLIALAEVAGEGRADLQFEHSVALLDTMIASLDKVDRNQAHRAFKVSFELLPLSWLRWITDHAPENTVEMRLALASLKAQVPGKAAGSAAIMKAAQPFRSYRFGITKRYHRFWEVPEVRPLRAVWTPRSLEDNLVALCHRRLAESSPPSPVPFRGGFSAPVPDVLAFINGNTDDELLALWLDRFSLFSFAGAKGDTEPLRKWCGNSQEKADWNEPLVALYAFMRPLLDEGLLQSLKAGEAKATRSVSNREKKSFAVAGRFAPVASALERYDAITAWSTASSAFHAAAVPVADFPGRPFSSASPHRLLAALIIPADWSGGLPSYFRRHWRRPSIRQPENANAS